MAAEGLKCLARGRTDVNPVIGGRDTDGTGLELLSFWFNPEAWLVRPD